MCELPVRFCPASSSRKMNAAVRYRLTELTALRWDLYTNEQCSLQDAEDTIPLGTGVRGRRTSPRLMK
jgi:hypothetical protein